MRAGRCSSTSGHQCLSMPFNGQADKSIVFIGGFELETQCSKIVRVSGFHTATVRGLR